MKRLVVLLFAAVLLTTVAGAARRSGELSKKELKVLLANASAPQDHVRLARHYEAKAKQYETESAEHAEMAKMYRKQPPASETKRPGAADTAAHCESISESLARAAKEARALAASHEQMAR
jgi:hypothetical protein